MFTGTLTTSKTLGFLVLFSPISLEARDKTDVVYMKNGDKITCEIKELTRGRLSISIDYMVGDQQVDWSEMERIETSQPFQVQHTGSFGPG